MYLNIPSTLTQTLRENRRRKGSVTYVDGSDRRHQVSFSELYDQALGILYHLQKWGLAPGDELILSLHSNEAFLDAFWACVLGGIIPVPVAAGNTDQQRQKVIRILQTLKRPHLYCEQSSFDRLAAFAETAGQCGLFPLLKEKTFLVDWISDLSRAGKCYDASPQDLLFVQFSSGSTREPQGVLLSHQNVMANIAAILEAGRFTSDDVSLSWMPLTHDMGLVGFHLNMLAGGIRHLLMPTELFVRRPLFWLELAGRERATVLCSPNFGYRHFLKVWEGKGLPSDIDLSCVRLIFNGAEPISVPLCREFLDKMATYGLKRSAMFTVYGLAEASLAVTFPEPEKEFGWVSLERKHLSVGQTIQPVTEQDPNAVSLAVVGRPIRHCRLRIVDKCGEPLDEGIVGRIQIAGRNVTRGYYGSERRNSEVFVDEQWVDTGDLGFQTEEELVVTGRSKEIIFCHGQNYYPHDLEALTLEIPALELGKVVVAGARPPGGEADEVLVFVLHRKSLEELVETADRITEVLSRQAGVQVAKVIPVRRIPKTSSGKLQRHYLVRDYLKGEFEREVKGLEKLRARLKPPNAASSPSIESQLLEICRNVLSRQDIEADDNLFDLGTSSLDLVRIHEGIEELFPGRIDATELFDYPNVAALASCLEKKLKKAVAS